MKKNLLSLLLVVVLMMTMLGGCGSDNKVNESGAEKAAEAEEKNGSQESDGASQKNGADNVTIDIFQNKSEVASQLEAAAELYMEANPGITVNIETVQGNEYNTALKTKMITGDGIDIMALSANDIANNYTEYLEDLSDQGWIEHVSSGLLGDAKLDGNVVGLPVNIEGYGIAYNKAIFDAAGIDTSELVTYEAIDQAFADLQNMIDEGKLTDEFPLLEAVRNMRQRKAGYWACILSISPWATSLQMRKKHWKLKRLSWFMKPN